jgi:hypothetical protein
MVLPTPVALAMLNAPVNPFKLVTADPEVKQVAQVRLPAASRASGPLALTAIVPVAFGIVIVLLPLLGVAKVRVFVTPPLVAVRLVLAPCRVRFCAIAPIVSGPLGVMVLTAKAPAMLTVAPLSLMMELPMVLLPVNLASWFVVPPGVDTLPPTPTQLPAVVQMS